MSIQELKDIANKLFPTLSKWEKKGDISITGGEPFVRKDLFPFLEYLDSSEDISDLDILSNGTMITDEIAEKLKKLTKLDNIQISLDGSSPETHDIIRSPGNFEKAIRGIKVLIRHGIDVKVMFTLQRCNMKDILSIIDLAIKEKISGLTIERLVPMGSAKDMRDSILSPEELRDIFQSISDRADLDYEKGTQLRILKYRPLWINIDPSRAKAELNTTPYKELGAVCSIGLDGLTILPDATVLPCRRFPVPIGNLKRDSLEKIWFTSDLLWQIRDKNNLKGKCNSCEFIPRCSGCRAMAYACTGDYLAEDPQCWK
jgi:radical SAM protein with 4Fe4S-binding SPASM domain